MTLLRRALASALASIVLFIHFGSPQSVALGGTAQDAEEPRFLDGDLGELEARVLSSKELLKDAPLHLLEIEVRNRGEFPVEPLAFEFVVPGATRKDTAQTHFARRVEEPWAGRAGRTIPAGGTLQYPLLAPVPKKLAKKTEVRVVSASFTEAEPLGASFLDMQRPRVEKSFDAELGRTRKDTRVLLTNNSRREVEVILRAEVQKPQDVETLVHVRLAPKEERDVLIDQFKGPWGHMTWEPQITKLELVDWSSIHAVDADAAIAGFEEAYRSWVRWPETWPGVSGWFEMSVRDYQHHDCRGRFSIDRAGNVEVEPDSESSSSARGEAVGLIEDAFRDLMHPTYEEVLEQSEFELIDEGPPQVLRMAKGPHLRSQGDQWVWTDQGRIRSLLLSGDRLGAREDWATLEFGDGWLIRGRDIYSSSTPPPMYEDRWAFDELAGQPVPTLYERRTVPVASRTESFSRIEFGAFRPGVELEFPTEPPTGPLAETLRAAWDAAYRYPSEPVTLRGRFSVKHPGTDGVWRGVLKVRGDFELLNFRGGRWSGHEVHTEGEYHPETLDGVGNAMLDRIQLYMGRDFSARPAFDRAFAGASLEEVRPGVIAVSDSRFLEVTIENGHIASYRFGDSTHSALRTFTLTRVKGQTLPKRVQTGDEVLEYQFDSLGDGWIVPEKVTMERVFGADWGPEVMTLSKMSLSGD